MNVHDLIPFLAPLATTRPPGGHGPQLNTTRLIEAFVIAAFTALASGYVTGQVMEERLAALTKRVDKVEESAEKVWTVNRQIEYAKRIDEMMGHLDRELREMRSERKDRLKDAR